MDDAVDRAPAEPAQTTRHTSLEGHGARDDRMLKALFDQSATGFASGGWQNRFGNRRDVVMS